MEIDVLPDVLPPASLYAAVTVTFPDVTAVRFPAVENPTNAAGEALQVTLEVRSCMEASQPIPVALNCCVAPTTMDEFIGVTRTA